jgi:hypothetical protein
MIFVIVFVILTLLGYFLSAGGKPVLEFDWFKDLLVQNGGMRVLGFIIAVMAAMGMLNYFFYTAYGFSSLSIGMIRGKERIEETQDILRQNIEHNRDTSRAIQAKYAKKGAVSSRDKKSLEELEEQSL